MSDPKELAYRYDIFIAPDWRDRFDSLVDEHLEIPPDVRVLDVNCGTGAHAIELADKMRGKGQVKGLDPSKERVEIARAKAQVKKLADLTFEQGDGSHLPYGDGEFDVVIGDASMAHSDGVRAMMSEMVRVARDGGSVILKMATHGSFDEFFSIYWEALLGAGLVDEVWSSLEALILERATVSQAEAMAQQAGLRAVASVCRKEEFLYESGPDFINDPLIEDAFLSDWLSIVPAERREEVRDRIVSIIERERLDGPFDISIKATVIAGTK